MILLKISSISFKRCKKGPLFCQKVPHFVQKNPPVEVSGYGIAGLGESGV